MRTDHDRPPSLPEAAGTTGGHPGLGRSVVGGFFLVMGGVHLGIVSVDPQTYDAFADQALFPFVREGWQQIVMAQPAFWGLCLMAGEIVLGSLLLVGGRAARWGWIGVIAFHLLLMLFGFWVWLWSVPVIALLVWLARRDLRPLPAR
jgi:hypothetical protein